MRYGGALLLVQMAAQHRDRVAAGFLLIVGVGAFLRDSDRCLFCLVLLFILVELRLLSLLVILFLTWGLAF